MLKYEWGYKCLLRKPCKLSTKMNMKVNMINIFVDVLLSQFIISRQRDELFTNILICLFLA